MKFLCQWPLHLTPSFAIFFTRNEATLSGSAQGRVGVLHRVRVSGEGGRREDEEWGKSDERERERRGDGGRR